MKIAWFCIPAAGHTNPTLAVVRHLTDAGHTVRYYSFKPFQEKLEAAGAVFIPVDDYCAEMQLSPADGKRVATDTAFATKVLVDTTLALDDAMLADLRIFQPDVIVADSMAMWGKLLAIKLGVPFVSSTTTFAFNKESAKVMKQGLGDLFKLLLSLPKINNQLKRLQQRGYMVKSILDVVQNDNDTNTVVYTSKYFQPSAESFSDKYTFAGPSVTQRPPLPHSTKLPRVYISMGTVNNDMPALYRTCIQALAGKYELILSVGHQVDPVTLGDLPPHVTVAQYVDQMVVLADCDAFLTHCGMNSVSEVLYCGVPLILFPQTAEQQGVANRTVELSAGLMLTDATEASIRASVDTVIANPKYRNGAAKVQESFRACSGPKAAADAILRVAEA